MRWTKTDSRIARIAGVILFVFGIGLATLSVWIIERQLTFHGALSLDVLTVVLVLSVISLFCIVVGYRLAFNRPNRYGSILSPSAWIVLGAIFGILGLGTTAYVVIFKLFDTQFITAVVSPFVFAVLCWRASAAARKRVHQ